MKTEILVLISDDEHFCSDESSLIKLLEADSLLSIKNKKDTKEISLHSTTKPKDIDITANLSIVTNPATSNAEHYFLLTLEINNNDDGIENLIVHFYDLCERVRHTINRISSEKITINTVWDDVGSFYAEKAYPIINDVENLMRKLITMFLTINVGMNWAEKSIHIDILKETEKINELSPYLNDLYKLDFIKLTNVLFDSRRDINIHDLDKLLRKTKFDNDDQKKIKTFIAKSNWERYFAELLDIKDSDLKTKWELLYKLRNRVAHNRNITNNQLEEIKGLSSTIKAIINKSFDKLNEIHLSEIEKNIIKNHSLIAYSKEEIGYIINVITSYYRKQKIEVYYLGNKYEINFVLLEAKPSGTFKPIGVAIFYIQEITLSFIEEKMTESTNFNKPTFHSEMEDIVLIFVTDIKALEGVKFITNGNHILVCAEKSQITLYYKNIDIIFGYIKDEEFHDITTVYI